MTAEHREAHEIAEVTQSFLGATNKAVDVAAELMLTFPPIPPGQPIDKELKKTRTVLIDNAAIAAMETVFEKLPIGTNVDACEGKKEANKDGEEVDVLSGHHGSKTGKQFSVIIDPIEGTTAACKRQEGATSMLAYSEQGGLVPTPMLSEFVTLPEGVKDGEVSYMYKLVASAEANGVLDLSRGPRHNVGAMVELYGGQDKVNLVVMNRPANQDIIDAAQEAGVQLTLIESGDLLPSLAAATGTLIDGKHIVVYGRGGDQEGRIAAAAAKSFGGFTEGQIWIPREDDPNYSIDGLPVYSLDELVPGKPENTGVVFTALTNESTYFGLRGRDNGTDTLQHATSMAIVHPDVADILRAQVVASDDLLILSR